jgi:hypothetical protein
MLVCVDPDAIDTHKGRWLEIDTWLEGVGSVREDEPRLALPDAYLAPEPSACDQACVGGWG